MAEERLMDDDKDKKYRFRINADGEEELVIDMGGEQTYRDGDEEELAEHAFDDDYVYGGEACSDGEAVEGLLASARADMAAGNYSTALEYAVRAWEISPRDGEVAAAKLEIYTRGLTDFSDGALAEAASAARDVKEYCGGERRRLMGQSAIGRLDAMMEELSAKVEALSEDNERGKAQRAAAFAADNRRSVIKLAVTGISFAVMLALSIFFSTIMYANTSGVNVVLTAVFAGVALLFFVALLFALRSFSVTYRRVRMNRDNSRTQTGRDYEAAKARLDNLREIRDALL